jgi:Raf kinase inhibitor-like YbhB/YbcL family protein
VRTLLALCLVACTGGNDPTDTTTTDTEVSQDPGSFTLTVPDLVETTHTELADACDLELPEAFECANGNPEVIWARAPNTTSSFVLIFDDPDAGDFPHWAVWNIPAETTSLAEGASGRDVRANLPDGSSELDNGFGWTGYLGSCPPTPHVYRWRIWAVDDTFSFTDPGGDAAASFEALAAAAEAAALGTATACHTYGPAVSPP